MFVATKNIDGRLVDRLAVNASEAARLLGVCRTTVRVNIKNGKIRTAKVGTRRLIPVCALHEFLAESSGYRAASNSHRSILHAPEMTSDDNPQRNLHGESVPIACDSRDHSPEIS